jgi:hypothetical protein
MCGAISLFALVTNKKNKFNGFGICGSRSVLKLGEE